MNRRRSLHNLHHSMARRQQEAAQPPAPAAAEMPFERLSIAALDRAGASLLPREEPEPEPEPEPLKRCTYCGGPNEAEDDFYCSLICAIEAQGEEDR